MLTFNVIVAGKAVHRVEANSKRLATAKINRWIKKVTGSNSTSFTLQADRASTATVSISRKRTMRNGDCIHSYNSTNPAA